MGAAQAVQSGGSQPVGAQLPPAGQANHSAGGALLLGQTAARLPPLRLQPAEWALVVALVCLILISIIGNCLVCVAIFTDRRLRKLGNAFIVSLAIADLFVSCLVMTFALCNDLLEYWMFGPSFCDIWMSFDVMCCTASILNLCAISLDRFIHIKDCLLYNQWMTKRAAASAVLAIWFISALVSFVPITLHWHKPPDAPSVVQLAAAAASARQVHWLVDTEQQHRERLERQWPLAAGGQVASLGPPNGTLEARREQQLQLGGSLQGIGKLDYHLGAAAASDARASSPLPLGGTFSRRQVAERAQELGQLADERAAAAAAAARHHQAIEPPPPSSSSAQFQPATPPSDQPPSELPQCMLTLTPTYAVVSSTISFYIPCLIMLGLYSRLFACARRHVRNIRAISRALPPAPTVPSAQGGGGGGGSSLRAGPKQAPTIAAALGLVAARAERRSDGCDPNRAPKSSADANATTTTVNPSSPEAEAPPEAQQEKDGREGQQTRPSAGGAGVQTGVGVTFAEQLVAPSSPPPTLGRPARTWIKFGRRPGRGGAEPPPPPPQPKRTEAKGGAEEQRPFLSDGARGAKSVGRQDSQPAARSPNASCSSRNSSGASGLRLSLAGALSAKRRWRGAAQPSTSTSTSASTRPASQATCSGGGAKQPTGASGGSSNASQLATHKAAITLGIIMGTFLFCWVPFFCLNIIKAFCVDCIPSSMFRAFTWLGYANSALNPIIYGIHNSEFRNAFNRIFFKHLTLKNGRQYLSRRFSYDLRPHSALHQQQQLRQQFSQHFGHHNHHLQQPQQQQQSEPDTEQQQQRQQSSEQNHYVQQTAS